MFSRLLHALAFLALKKPAWVLLLVVLLWLLAGWQLLPRLLQSQAESVLAEHGHALSMQRPRFNPFTWRLELAGVELKDGQAQPLLRLEHLVVDLSAASLWRRALVFDELQIVAPQAHLQLLGGGRNNWTPLLEAFASAEDEPPSASLPRLEITRFSLQRGVLEFADRPARFATRLSPLELELNQLSTLPAGHETGHYHITAQTALGARLDWRGRLSVAELAAAKPAAATTATAARPETVQQLALQGDLVVQGLELAKLQPYAQAARPGLELAGQLALRLDYVAHYSAGAFDLDISQLTSQLQAVRVRDGLSGVGVHLAELALQGGRYQLASHQLALESVSLRQTQLELARAGTAAPLELLRLPELRAEQLALDLAGRRLELAALRARGGQVQATRLPQGQIDVVLALQQLSQRLAAHEADSPLGNQAAEVLGKGSAAESVTEAEGGADHALPPWRYRLGMLELADFAADWTDQTLRPAAQLGLRGILLSVQDISEDLRAAWPIKAQLAVASGGQLTLAGWLVPASTELQADVNLSDLALAVAQPYLAQRLKLQIASGSLGVTGQVRHRPVSGQPTFKGGFSLQHLRLEESENQQLMLGLQGLTTRELSLDAQGVTIGTLLLTGLDTQLHIARDKSLNFSRLLRTPAAPAADGKPVVGGAAHTRAVVKLAEAEAAGALGKVGSPAPAVRPKPSFTASIERLRLQDSALDFSDASLALPFGTRIHKLHGLINGLSTVPGRRARVQLEGQVDDYGLARAHGQLDIADPTGFSDLKVVFRNVAMSSLTPYAATFAGRRIDSGKLSLDLDYRIQQRQLSGENQVVIDQLVLGERVESPQAKDLPLDLALALLQDADGRIDLGLPVSGSLDDPQFSIGSLVWKVLTNVLTKLVSAPFRALGVLFGAAEDFEDIVFDAGSARLRPPEQEKLRQLADVLQKRPALQLKLTGVWSEADRRALQERETRIALAQLAGLQDVRDGSDPGALATSSLPVQQALEERYAERLGKERLTALKAGFRRAHPGQLPPSTAERLLAGLTGLVHAPVPLDDRTQARLAGDVDFHELLFDELSAQVDIGVPHLQKLAQRRAQALQQGLIDAGVARERLPLAEPRQVDGRKGEVPMAMELQPGAGVMSPVPSPA